RDRNVTGVQTCALPISRPEDLPRLVKNPFAYRYEYADGTKATLLSLSGLVRDFNFAARLKGRDEPLSTQMYYPLLTLRNFFSPLDRKSVVQGKTVGPNR